MALSLRAQDPNVFTSLWRSTFDASGPDVPFAITLDSQGSILVAGRTSNTDTHADGLIVKVDSFGQRVWARRFDSPISEDDQFNNIAVDSAGNVAIAGTATERDAPNSLLVASYGAANGATRWLKTFPGKHIATPSVAVDSSGDVYARTAVESGVGQTIRTYKFSSTGNALWTNEIFAARDMTYGLNNPIPLIVQADGANFLAALTTSNAGDLDWQVVRLGANGSQAWRATFGRSKYESPPLLALHSSGDLLISGSSENDGGGLDIVIQRLNPASGARIWQTKLKGSSAFKAGSHVLVDLKSDALGNIWLAGNSPTWGGFVSRFDSSGYFEWTTHFPQTAVSVLPLGDGRAMLSVTSDGGIGWIGNDGTVLKAEFGRYQIVAAADAARNVFIANSFYKSENQGDFGLTIEKLQIDRDPLAPKFTKVPQFTTGAPQQDVELIPELTGDNLTYQWLHNGQLIPGETNRTLTIPFLNANSIGYYSVQANNSHGSTLSPDIEVLTATPIFIRQPRDQTFAYDGDVAFSALAVGFEPQLDVSSVLTTELTYQWYFNGFPLNGETQSKLLIRNVDETWIGRYQVRATLTYPDLGIFFYADSDQVTLDWSSQDIDEIWREQFLLTGQPWSRPTNFEIKSNGDVALSLQSPSKLVRANVADREVLSDVAETFRPPANVLPKGAHFKDSQGNFYAIGETNTLDTSVDWMIARHAANGALLWEQTVSGLGRGIDFVLDAVVDVDDDIVVTGRAASETTGYDALTVCLNKSDGSMRWNNVFDDPNGVRVAFAGEVPSAIAADRFGNIYVAGTGFWPTNGFYFLVSYDTNGVTRYVYQRAQYSGNDQPPRLAVEPDGTAVLGGTFGLLKLDPNGRELFVSDLRINLDSPPPLVYGLQIDRGGNIYISGRASGSGAFGKFSAFGYLITQINFATGFPDQAFDPSSNFFVDDYGNSYLAGTGGNVNSEQDIVAVKFDSYMNRLWMARVDGLSQNRDQGLDIKVQGSDVFLVGSAIGDNTMEASVVKFFEYSKKYLVKDVTTSKTIRRGSTLRLEAQAFGNPVLFQWYRNSQPIQFAWSAAVDIPNVTSADEGFYSLRVSDSLNSVYAFDAGFSIRVADPPAITKDPKSTNVFVNGQILLTSTATGTAPLTYQWLRGGNAIPNATNVTLTIDGAQFSDRGDYRLVVSNDWGAAASAVATVKVVAPTNLPPIVTMTEPADRWVQRDTAPVQFRAVAYDADGRVTQVAFRVNGVAVATLPAPPFETRWTPPSPGIFKVTAIATDNFGATSASQEVEVVIAPAPVIVKHPPEILNVTENGDITLEAEANSSPPPRYQWRLNGANIPGATNRTFTIGGAQARNSGRYAVLAINEGAATISSRTEVIVDAPALTLSDSFASAVTVTDTQFVGRGNNRNATKENAEPNHARRRGGKSVWLRWRAPSSGVMTISTAGSAFDTMLAIYTGNSVGSLTQVTADDERGGFHTSATRFNAVKGQIYNIAVDGFKGQSGNIVLSWALDASARDLPVITAEPDSAGSSLGGVAAFHVDALGNNLKFQWFLNGYPVPSATNSGLVLPGLARRNLGDYIVRVTNDGGSVESEVAELELGNSNERVTQDRVEDLLAETAPNERAGMAAAGTGYPTISPGIPYRKFFNTAGATADDNEPVLGDGGGASKWYFVTAGGAGTLVADTIGSDFPTVITLHDPTDTETLPVLARGEALRGGASRVTYPTVAGTSFLIRVDGLDEREGNVVLNITIGSQPQVVSAPLDQVIAPGQSAILSATVNAAPAAAYQWYLNDKPLPGQTTATLQLTNFDPAQVGAYSLEAVNALGSAKKTIAYIELARDLLFTAPIVQSDGSMQLRLEGNTRTYWIDFTEDFQTWTNLFSGRVENGSLLYNTTPAANQQHGFYRARWQ